MPFRKFGCLIVPFLYLSFQQGAGIVPNRCGFFFSDGNAVKFAACVLVEAFNGCERQCGDVELVVDFRDGTDFERRFYCLVFQNRQ